MGQNSSAPASSSPTLAALLAIQEDMNGIRLEPALSETRLAEMGEDLRKTAEQYQKMMREEAEQCLAMARKQLEMVQQLDPDRPANISATISSGDQLLAHIDRNGYLTPDRGGDYLYGINDQADAMGLKGQNRIDFVTSEIKRRYPGLEMTEYTAATRPTTREFAAKWYPEMNLDADYQKHVADAHSQLRQAEAWYAEQMKLYST